MTGNINLIILGGNNVVYSTYKFTDDVCPLWKVKVSIGAKYWLPNETNGPAKLVNVECPIADRDFRKKLNKEKEYEHLFCNHDRLENKICPLLEIAKFKPHLEYPY